MKLAKKFANLALLAFALSLGSTVSAQSQPAQKPAPTAKAAKSSQAAKPATAKPANAATAKPAKVAAANSAKVAAKPAKVAAKSASATPAPAKAPVEAPAPEKTEPIVAKRDPFLPLVSERTQAAAAEHLPPGKAGLVISSVRVDGTVKAPNGMIAVVSNPEQRVYFVREGDHLYDGDVQKIGLDGVTFKENSKDAFGKAVERLVTKRIYPSAGEQQ